MLSIMGLPVIHIIQKKGPEKGTSPKLEYSKNQNLGSVLKKSSEKL